MSAWCMQLLDGAQPRPGAAAAVALSGLSTACAQTGPVCVFLAFSFPSVIFSSCACEWGAVKQCKRCCGMMVLHALEAASVKCALRPQSQQAWSEEAWLERDRSERVFTCMYTGIHAALRARNEAVYTYLSTSIQAPQRLLNKRSRSHSNASTGAHLRVRASTAVTPANSADTAAAAT